MKLSKTGMAAAGIYILAAAVIFIAHLYSVKTNAGDSGESAIPLFLLSLPWMLLIPSSWTQAVAWAWLAYPLLWLCIAFNALLIYLAVSLAAVILKWLGNNLLAVFAKKENNG